MCNARRAEMKYKALSGVSSDEDQNALSKAAMDARQDPDQKAPTATENVLHDFWVLR